MMFGCASRRASFAAPALVVAWTVLVTGLRGDERPTIANSLDMRFVRIPAGEFLMGAAPADDSADGDERPQHKVRITRDFHLAQFETTQGAYQAVMGENPSWFSPSGGGRDALRIYAVAGGAPALPVEMVSWDEAVEFCRKLSALPAERAAGRRYRLPTEAEWEYAARLGIGSNEAANAAPKFGDANLLFDGDLADAHTVLVHSFGPDRLGLYEMQGNVWEWCSDHYDAAYYSVSPTDDPQGPLSGTGRVVRGGDYRSPAKAARVTNRDFTRASRRDWGNGFRVVLEPSKE